MASWRGSCPDNSAPTGHGLKETAVGSMHAPTASGPLQHVDCVTSAAVELFESTCAATLEPVAGDAHAAEPDGVIVAVISLVGDVEWAVLLGMPRDTASGVATKFAGFEIAFDSEDMGDAIGELTNIFAGLVKANLDRSGVRVEMSLPSVMRGESLEMLSRTGIRAELTCFGSELGKVWAGVLAAARARAPNG